MFLREGMLPVMRGVFLSYARHDGEARAAEIREQLTRETLNIVIRQDRLFLEGGTDLRGVERSGDTPADDTIQREVCILRKLG